MQTPPSASVAFGLCLAHSIRAEVFHTSGAPERAAWEERQADKAFQAFRASPSPASFVLPEALPPAAIAARFRQTASYNRHNAELAQANKRPRDAARHRLNAMHYEAMARDVEASQ